MLDQRDRVKMLQLMDQENAAIAETLACDEYLALLMATLSANIELLKTAAKRPDVSPESAVIIPGCLIDILTILRMAQIKLCDHILAEDNGEESVSEQ